MNRFFSLIILLVSLAQLTDAQTRVWKVPGYYTQLQEDGIGNAYIGSGMNGAVDSLKKIGPHGEVIWSVELGQYLDAVIRYSGSGVYVFRRRHLNSNNAHDTLTYFDTAGTKMWDRSFPEEALGGISPDFPSVDKNGNLLLQYDSLPFERRDYGTYWAPINRRLLKIGPDGKEVFNVQLPLLSRRNVRIDRFSDPIVDNLNNIWIVATAETLTAIKTTPPAYDDYSTTYQSALLVNGTSGNLIASFPLWEGISWVDKRNAAGTKTNWYGINGDYPYSSVTTVGDKLVAFGTFAYESGQINGSKRSGKALSEWRLAVVGESGKTKFFRYKGKSVFKDDRGTRTDNFGNELLEVFAADDGSLYLHGLISAGRSLETSTQNDVLLKLGSGTYLMKWKIIGGGGPEFIPTILHIGSQKILRNAAPNTLAVYGLNGVPAAPFVFPDGVDVNQLGGFYGLSLQGPQVEPGYFYVRDVDATEEFLSKYNLPAMVQPVTSKGQVIDDLQASTFEVSQNYPNPFNPTTTIHVELPTDALVTIKVFNLLGQEVATLADHEALVEGANNLEFDGSQLPSGTYFYRTVAEDVETGKILFTTVKRMMLIK